LERIILKLLHHGAVSKQALAGNIPLRVSSLLASSNSTTSLGGNIGNRVSRNFKYSRTLEGNAK
jgi:hypothetical protein